MKTKTKSKFGNIIFKATGRILVNGKYYTSFTDFERHAKNETQFKILIRAHFVKGFAYSAFVNIEFTNLTKRTA